MINSKPARKPHQTESYSHPLIKTLADSTLEDHSKIFPTYQPIIASHRNRTSSKILRCSTLTPSRNSTFTAFISPFHPLIHSLPVLVKPLQCSLCQCVVNPLSKIQNYSTLQCNLCGGTTTIGAFESQQYKDSFAYQYECISSEKNVQEQGGKRRVCLVIEASQYNFEKKVHRGIINCLWALNSHDFEFALIFFDTKYIYFIDQHALSITKISLSREDSDPLEGWDSLPLEEDELFSHISQFNEEVASIIESIMYQAYYIKETALSEVTHLLHKHLHKCEIKYFITTLNHLADQEQNQQQAGLLSKIFKEKQNCPSNQKKKISVLQTVKQWRGLSLAQNMQFFVVSQNTTYQQSIDTLGYHLAKAYGLTEKALEETVYYDLFQNIEIRQMTNVELTLTVNNCIEFIQPQFPAYSLYGKLVLLETFQQGKFKRYRLCLKQCCQTTMIPLKLKVNSSINCEKPFFQVAYSHPLESAKRVVLNSESLKVYAQTEMGLQWLDDQSLFNDHFRKAVCGWKGGNFKQLKQCLEREYEQLIRLFKNNYRYDSINFPKTMKHYFLYLFSILEKIKKGMANTYFIYKLLNCGLETFSKQLYYRTYRLESGEVRNIKSNFGVFEKYTIVMMENGEDLFMVFSDTAVSQIKDVFGYYDTVSSLANDNFQLPELATNLPYRDAIEAIRQSNTESFLRLKIIDKQSSFFDCFIAPSLYDKTQHLDFLRKAWKNA